MPSSRDQNTLADAQEAAKTDAQRYADDIQIGDISIKPGDHHDLKPSISNPQASADGSITLPGQAGLKTLPFGTTAKWHDAAKVAADAMHAGDYIENVDITYPDGSQASVKAQLHVVTPSAPVHGNGNAGMPSEGHNGQASNVKISKDGKIVVIDNDATTTPAPITREAYRAAQNAKANSKTAELPQTGDNHSSLALVSLGLMLGLGSLLGFSKKQD